VNYAADDQHIIAAVNRGEGDIRLAEGEFSVTHPRRPARDAARDALAR